MPIAYYVHKVLTFLRYKVFAKMGIKTHSRYISITGRTSDGRRTLTVMERDHSGPLDVGGGDKDTLDRIVIPLHPQLAHHLSKRYDRHGGVVESA